MWFWFSIASHLKPDVSFRCKWCTGLARPIDGRLMTYRKTANISRTLTGNKIVDNSDVVGASASHRLSHGENSMSSCPSSPPAHFTSPPEEEFTLRASEMPCSMQAKPGPQRYPTCIACNAMAELWFAGCAVLLAWSLWEDAAWRSAKGTLHPPTQMARPCRT